MFNYLHPLPKKAHSFKDGINWRWLLDHLKKIYWGTTSIKTLGTDCAKVKPEKSAIAGKNRPIVGIYYILTI